MPAEDYPGFEWLGRYWDELGGFNFQWIAVTQKGPIAHDSDLAEVVRSVIRQGAQNNAVYAFVDFPEVRESSGSER
jgi:hypothetical protein